MSRGLVGGTVRNSLLIGWVVLMFIGVAESVRIVSESFLDVGVGVLSLLDFLVAVTSYGLIAFIVSVLLFLVYEVANQVILK